MEELKRRINSYIATLHRFSLFSSNEFTSGCMHAFRTVLDDIDDLSKEEEDG